MDAIRGQRQMQMGNHPIIRDEVFVWFRRVREHAADFLIPRGVDGERQAGPLMFGATLGATVSLCAMVYGLYGMLTSGVNTDNPDPSFIENYESACAISAIGFLGTQISVVLLMWSVHVYKEGLGRAVRHDESIFVMEDLFRNFHEHVE